MAYTPEEIERMLGERYAEAIRENTVAIAPRDNGKEIINASLMLMEHYGRMNLSLNAHKVARINDTRELSLAS